MLYFFFFQAEDGIRDSSVTGVQTCALPISRLRRAFRTAHARTPPREPNQLGIRGKKLRVPEGETASRFARAELPAPAATRLLAAAHSPNSSAFRRGPRKRETLRLQHRMPA